MSEGNPSEGKDNLFERIMEDQQRDKPSENFKDTGVEKKYSNKYQRNPPKKKGKSKKRNEECLRLGSKYGLVKCDFQEGKHTPPCKGLIIVKDGWKRSECPKCGRTRKLTNTVLLYESDSQAELRSKRAKIKQRNGL